MTTDSDKVILGKLEVMKHIHKVRSLLYRMIEELDRRAREHDQSKLEGIEAELYGEYTPELAKCEYMSEDYKKLLEKVRPAIEHHYAVSRHHPEHFAQGIDDMTLVDLIEMLVDWKAATERNKNGNIRTSIEKNIERFKISPQLAQILQNTVREMFRD